MFSSLINKFDLMYQNKSNDRFTSEQQYSNQQIEPLEIKQNYIKYIIVHVWYVGHSRNSN